SEAHAEGLELGRDDLVLRRGGGAPDRASAAGEVPGDRGDLVLRDIPVVAVERLAGDGEGGGLQEDAGGPGDVGGVDVLAAPPAVDVPAPRDVGDQVEPLALPRGVGQAVDPG